MFASLGRERALIAEAMANHSRAQLEKGVKHPVVTAAAEGNTRQLTELVDENPDLVNDARGAVDGLEELTPLVAAAWKGR
jgi:hypothetical protein